MEAHLNKHPDSFLKVLVHEYPSDKGYTGLSVGYERGEWRYEDFADHIMEWLPEFALSRKEYEDLDHHNAIRLIKKAAKSVYTSEKYEKRGEFGEILLHIALCQVFDSQPAISKIYFKSASNNTVKGFDSVHVVESGDDLELWIGEVKFYEDINQAINHVVTELKEHTETGYLKNEFVMISNKLDSDWKHTKKLKRMISKNESLDKIFKKLCIPVLLTYNSDTVDSFSEVSEEYEKSFKKEIKEASLNFSQKNLPPDVQIHLFLVPLLKKKVLVEMLDSKLKAWQK